MGSDSNQFASTRPPPCIPLRPPKSALNSESPSNPRPAPTPDPHGPPLPLPGAPTRACAAARAASSARLRDSRVLARSAAAASRSLPPTRRPASPAPVAGDGGMVPHFVGAAARGMRYPLRKKLAAASSVVFLPPPRTDGAEVFLDAFVAAPSDLVAAH
ncbi:uncharacterized protein LOC133927778 [Phragmites australis]|uniref:uncharacterized protein LOC133927778 n=1 Tax=Phragmites australis TaxID=29695 RepID=UPI002D793A64|nr:uncharacterized protein LOC133927778 [Phragmites australis]